MKSLLLLAYAYPPISSPGAVRATRMIRHLFPRGWEASVFTVKDGYSQRIGGLADPLENTPEKVSRLSDPIAKANTRYANSNSETHHRKPFVTAVKSAVKSRLKALLFPGRAVLWANNAQKITIPTGIDMIYSTSPTPATHRAGYALAKKNKLPWIAEFRDPLSWLGERHTASRFWRWRLARYEAWVVKNATAVVVVSDTFKDYFLSRYPNANIISIPNGAEFSIETINQTLTDRKKQRKERPTNKLRLVHTGSLYGGARPPKNLIAACQKAMAISDLKIECIFAGNDAHLATEAANDLGCTDIVKNVGTLTHSETVDLLKSADATISLLHREKLGKLSIMSKFLDYLPAGAPILNLGGSDYVLSRIISNQKAGASFEYEDIDGIADWLLKLPDMPPPDTLRLCQEWSAEKMAQRMVNLFEDVLKNA